MIKLDFHNIRLQTRDLLNLPEQQKIEVLKMAYTRGIDVWFETSRIFLDAGIEEGGLKAETIEGLFETLILNSSDIYGDEII